ncbi:hypothetical protein IMG5_145460, partial [Ichthyophthirius multifiliis]
FVFKLINKFKFPYILLINTIYRTHKLFTNTIFSNQCKKLFLKNSFLAYLSLKSFQGIIQILLTQPRIILYLSNFENQFRIYRIQNIRQKQQFFSINIRKFIQNIFELRNIWLINFLLNLIFKQIYNT